MEYATSRRVGTTYGRSTKRIVVHDLFGNSNGTENIVKITSPELSVSATTHNGTEFYEVPTLANIERDPAAKNLSSRLASSSIPKKPGPPKHERTYTKSNNETDLFDIRSSDDEKAARSDLNSRKRHRALRAPREAHSSLAKQATTLAQRSGNAPVFIANAEEETRQKPSSQKQNRDHVKSQSTTQSDIGSKPSQKLAADMMASQRSKPRPAPRKKAPTLPQPQAVAGDVMFVDDFGSTDTSANLTDFSSRSIRSSSITPKRKRDPSQCSEENVPSPSQLGITALRLTPERITVTSRHTSPGNSSDNGETPRRVRPRLIDRLDGPAQPEYVTPTTKRKQVTSGEQVKSPDTQHRVRGRTKNQTQAESTQLSSRPALERSQSSQGRVTYATKARTTYAKERSHLSDMVDSLDSLGVSSSQNTSQGLFMQATTSNLASNLDFEDDESDGQPGAKILKSIHELRQAGAISRFDREVQGLLEDLEATGNINRSSRLRALMKLIRRLCDETFLGYFVSSGRTIRLARCTVSLSDLTSQTLLTVALYILSKAETSPEVLTNIFNSHVEIAPKLLRAHKSFSDLIHDPSEKLSKPNVKELATFEEYLSNMKSLSALSENTICPDGLTLTCLDETLRSLTRLGDHNAKMSTKCYAGILQLLEQYAQRLVSRQKPTVDLPVLERALSLIEVCSMVFDDMEVNIRDDQYRALGGSLATIMQTTTNEQETIEQGILKAVISLSNSKPRMCHLLGQSPIINAVFLTIDVKFVSVADRAELEQKLDQKKLDSVILALGCLLNFAECDGPSRQKIAHTYKEGHTYLERLVSMFNSQVDKAQEVMTSEQSQVLVAFGYLSMLLCTMSLDPKIRMQVTELLKDKSFEELCAAAETFFSHLRTLENISDDDASMSAFTARFSTILATIRNATVTES